MELRAQRREFVEMVSAQDAQVKALEAQSDIFKDERRRSREKEEAGAFNNEIRTLLGNVLEIRDEFQISSLENPHISTKIIPNGLEVNHTTDGYRQNDAHLKEIYKALKAGITTLQSTEINARLHMEPRVVETLEEFGKSLSSLEDFRPRLSYITKTRVDKLKISETKKLIDLFLKFSVNANLNDKTP